MTREQYRAALRLLVEQGLVTCTGGTPGDDDATYALAWAPLGDAESYPLDVQARHAANMRKLKKGRLR